MSDSFNGKWNYRVLETTFDDGGKPVTRHAIHEVYHRDEKPWSYSIEPAFPESFSDENTPPNLKEVLDRMINAVALPVLRPSDFSHVELPVDLNSELL